MLQTIAAGLIGWLVLAGAAAAPICAAKQHGKRTRGRQVMDRRGQTDYRMPVGEHRGRWASEVLVEDLDDADDAHRVEVLT